jgi:uncharacterized membrane protein YhaH (DUF805 family)
LAELSYYQREAQRRDVDFAEAVRLFFINTLDFVGRSSRGAYWFALLFLCVLWVMAGVAGAVFGVGLQTARNLMAILLFVPFASLSVRRLHDIGKTGFWFLLTGTGIGYLLILFWATRPGQRRQNGFGPDMESGREG